MGLVPASIENDKNESTVLHLDDDFYFSEPPVSINSIACLVDTYNNDGGNFINASRSTSQFSWDFNNHVKTMYHTNIRIPEMCVSNPTSVWQTLTTITTCVTGPHSYSILRRSCS